MTPFAYARADTLGDVTGSAAEHRSDTAGSMGTDVIAGGTDMIQLMREGLRAPARLLDVTGIKGLDRIDADGPVLRLGALVRMSDAAAHPKVQSQYRVISEALLLSASAQVRNLATLGGNLLQRTRCGYFRDPGAPCNKRVPGSGCPAIAGQNRLNAVLGISDQCIATYASDFANALLALDARVRIASDMGDRAIALADLHRAPERTPWIETHLAPASSSPPSRCPRRSRRGDRII